MELGNLARVRKNQVKNRASTESKNLDIAEKEKASESLVRNVVSKKRKNLEVTK